MNMNNEDLALKFKKFKYIFCVLIVFFASGMVLKSFQNDTFYTIKIGELIFKNGIDMMDHFSFHSGLAYTYPHWLYDCFIFLIYKLGGFAGIYISTIILLIILLLLVFKTGYKLTNNYLVAAFATFICSLAIRVFVTARAQLVSYILFVIEIYFIESFLKNGKKKYLIGLLLISLILCNVHVAVWPFYFIIFLPYLVEYLVAVICNKIKFKKEYKIVNFLKRKFVVERNKNIKYLFITMIVSILTGLITPIGDTPYTYLIKTMMGNSQNYIQEHQMISWASSPFALVIAGETIFLAFFSRIKLRDLFMICGLLLMSVFSIRHLALLAVIGTLCFSRVFGMFLELFTIDINGKILNFLSKKIVIILVFICVICFSGYNLYTQIKKPYIDKTLYPVKAVKYIKENVDFKNMRVFNDYNFGSYLLLNEIPVYIDSRADLYTKQFSGFDYDIFDDYEYILSNYIQKFEFYDITHVLLYKKDNLFYKTIDNDDNYELLYEDKDFAFYKKLEHIDPSSTFSISFGS